MDKPCPVCRDVEMIMTADGDYYCPICHPGLTVLYGHGPVTYGGVGGG